MKGLIGHYKVSGHTGFQTASWKREVSENFFPTREPEDFPSPLGFLASCTATSQSGWGSKASVWGLANSNWKLWYPWENLIKFQKLIIILFEKRGEETEATCFFPRLLCLDQGRPSLWLPCMANLCFMDSGSLLTEPLVGCIIGYSFSHSVIGNGIWRTFPVHSRGALDTDSTLRKIFCRISIHLNDLHCH